MYALREYWSSLGPPAEMLGRQKFPLLVGSSSSQNDLPHQNPMVTLCHLHHLCFFVWKSFATLNVPLVLGQQGPSFHFTQLSCDHMFTRVDFSPAVVTITCPTCTGDVHLFKYIPTSHRGNWGLTISESLTLNILRGIYRITKIFHLLALLWKIYWMPNIFNIQ